MYVMGCYNDFADSRLLAHWKALAMSGLRTNCCLTGARVRVQHDAACRVIARLKIERDEARQRLVQAERHLPAAAATPAVVPTSSPPVVASNGKRGGHLYIRRSLQDVSRCVPFLL